MAGKKSSLLAVILSLLVAGAGHVYLQSYRKAVLFLVFGEVLSAAIYLYVDPGAGEIISLLASAYAAYDAYRMNETANAAPKERTQGPDIRI